MWYKKSMRWDALEAILDDYLEAPEIKGIADARGGYASTQLSASAAAIGIDINPYRSYQRELEEVKASVEAVQMRAGEELEHLSLLAETTTLVRTSQLAGLCEPLIESTTDLVRKSMMDLEALFGNSSASAAAAYALSALLPADVYGVSAAVDSLRAGALQMDLSDTVQPTGAFSMVTGLGSLSALQSLGDSFAPPAFHKSYLDDLRESLHAFRAQELETFRQITSAAAIETTQLRSLCDVHSSNRFVDEDEIKRLVARHGPQFTMRHVLILEATARTAEQLLSIRNWRKITRKLSYISYMASSGSKILLLYKWLLLLMSKLLDSDFSDSPQLRSDRVRRSIKCLSPPPDQPLSRTPKVKPNAPNVTA